MTLSLTQSVTVSHRDILDTCDLWDIWSVWWENMSQARKSDTGLHSQFLPCSYLIFLQLQLLLLFAWVHWMCWLAWVASALKLAWTECGGTYDHIKSSCRRIARVECMAWIYDVDVTDKQEVWTVDPIYCYLVHSLLKWLHNSWYRERGRQLGKRRPNMWIVEPEHCSRHNYFPQRETPE